MAVKVELTGKTRYRALQRLFDKPLLVLQVQQKTSGNLEIEGDTGPYFETIEWRDATVEDATSVN